MRRAAALLALVAFACGPAPPSGSTLAFPRHSSAGEGWAALLEGTLILDGACLLIESETGERHLALWPDDHRPGASSDGRIGILDGGGRLVATVGEPILAAGGQTAMGAGAVTAGTTAEAARCPGWPWWLVTGIDT